MFKINLKNILINTMIVLAIFLLDRVTKIYIIKLAELESVVDIYITSYLNLYLIWNKGIAFGFLSFDNSTVYNLITMIIIIIIFIIMLLIHKSRDKTVYFLLFILGGAIGNLFDRIYYSSVPDFIDFHINGFHWFIFNVADIFVSIGVLCLILAEIFFNKKSKNEIS
jgi:signal peptidase II|tara:strand:- start:102 stop:602 length:501 start_codon:yes stop_codon:yes gene_type:complete